MLDESVRYLKDDVLQTMSAYKKMAFVVGSRQVGKTHFVQGLLGLPQNSGGYFNWDIETTRQQILKSPVDFWRRGTSPQAKRIAIDEIHKYPRWKRFLKSFYDANKNQVEVMVTGSGRLDIYQKGGIPCLGVIISFICSPFLWVK